MDRSNRSLPSGKSDRTAVSTDRHALRSCRSCCSDVVPVSAAFRFILVFGHHDRGSFSRVSRGPLLRTRLLSGLFLFPEGRLLRYGCGAGGKGERHVPLPKRHRLNCLDRGNRGDAAGFRPQQPRSLRRTGNRCSPWRGPTQPPSERCRWRGAIESVGQCPGRECHEHTRNLCSNLVSEALTRRVNFIEGSSCIEPCPKLHPRIHQMPEGRHPEVAQEEIGHLRRDDLGDGLWRHEQGKVDDERSHHHRLELANTQHVSHGVGDSRPDGVQRNVEGDGPAGFTSQRSSVARQRDTTVQGKTPTQIISDALIESIARVRFP